MKNLLLMTFFLLPFALFSQTTLSGKAVKIVDGDTFDLLVNEKTLYRIRLLDIDSPEKGQDYYKVSKQALSDYIFGSHLKVIYQKKDRNGRILGTVFNKNVNVNMIMVQEGYAWHFKKYSSDERYSYAEVQARKARRGLWNVPKPIAPWDFRKIRH